MGKLSLPRLTSRRLLPTLLGGFFLTGQAWPQALDLAQISLPAKFSIEIRTDEVRDTPSPALGEHGTFFAGSRRGGSVYAVTPADDGAVLVSDDYNGVIYRISYSADDAGTTNSR